jgi:hypothetical protein
MKFPPFYAALICAGLITLPARSPGQAAIPAATNASGPKLTFLATEYQFGKVTAGALVKHEFIASNAGDQTLVISKVTPGCHCTTAGGDWSKPHKLEPGRTEAIAIEFNSGNFHGDVTKQIFVESNDKAAPRQTLFLRGTVWRPIELEPQFAYINIPPDAPSNWSAVVMITNQSDEPVTLSAPSSANGLFKGDLKTNIPGRKFEVTITAVPPLEQGNNSGNISIKTSLTNMPMINISAVARYSPAVEVTPRQISLSPQVSLWTTNLITITAKGSKKVALSDPEASDKRVALELRTINEGRLFQLAAVFPPGFQISAGQHVDLSVKTDNPQRPVITVPVTQMQHRLPPSASPAHPRTMSQNPPAPPVPGHP